ncbi:hypothetical protein LDENG_00138440, partial [Lucifuga dentata]
MARFSASSRRCCRSLTATSRFFFILSSVVHFTLDLDQVSLKLLLCVQKACV